MIENTDQLYQDRSDILSKNPRNFAVFAEGPLDEIRNLQAEIAAYVQQLEQVAPT